MIDLSKYDKMIDEKALSEQMKAIGYQVVVNRGDCKK